MEIVTDGMSVTKNGTVVRSIVRDSNVFVASEMGARSRERHKKAWASDSEDV